MFNQIKILYDLEKLVFNLNQENIDEIVESTMKLFDIQFPISFNVMLIRFVYSFFVSKINIDPKLCIDYLLHIEKNEKAVINKSEKIIQIFSRYLSELETQESCFLLENLFEQKIIEPVIIKNLYNLYFAHYKDQNDIRVYKYLYLTFGKQFYSNIKELSKNDWELHKQLIKEGVNPKMIAKIIRNDEIEKLQGISSQPNFDFNQIIKKSLYERCSFVNTKNVSLIDYAAFFSAIKCFRYLLLNGANIENTMKFAIAGGSIEIIHLCEHNNLEIEKALTIAIKFHRNNIFHYLYEKSVNDIKDFDKLGIKCIRYDNYEIFLFLNEIGMKITLAIIKNAIEIGNIYFLNFIAKNQLPNLLIVSAETGNIEIVKLLLEQEEININIKDEDGHTALQRAAGCGYIDIVKLLLEQKGIDVNAKDNYGNTALRGATCGGFFDIVKLLLEQKEIDINPKNKEGITPLMDASKRGYTEIVKLLLQQKGIDVNAKTDDKGENAFIMAVVENHIDIVKLLVHKKGIDINAKDNWHGRTVLFNACNSCNPEMVELILNQEGIDVNAKDIDKGKTALMIAEENGFDDIVSLLKGLGYTHTSGKIHRLFLNY